MECFVKISKIERLKPLIISLILLFNHIYEKLEELAFGKNLGTRDFHNTYLLIHLSGFFCLSTYLLNYLSLIYLLIYSSIYSFIYLFVHSFIYLFIHSLIHSSNRFSLLVNSLVKQH